MQLLRSAVGVVVPSQRGCTRVQSAMAWERLRSEVLRRAIPKGCVEESTRPTKKVTKVESSRIHSWEFHLYYTVAVGTGTKTRDSPCPASYELAPKSSERVSNSMILPSTAYTVTSGGNVFGRREATHDRRCWTVQFKSRIQVLGCRYQKRQCSRRESWSAPVGAFHALVTQPGIHPAPLYARS
jgi:hypothetical protein